MNILKLFIITAILGFLLPQQLRAQTSLFEVNDMSNVNIDSYRDEQISKLVEKANELNVSLPVMYAKFKEKGLPESELEKLKDRIKGIETTEKESATETNKSDINKEGEVKGDQKYNQKEHNIPMQENKKDLAIFGAELFQKNSMVFEPNLRIGTPSSYILGPDDEINVAVFGLSEKKYTLKVSEDGDIYIPNVGPLMVNGLSIEQATSKIKSKLGATIYKAINSGQTKVQVTLNKIRSIRVTVIGEAEKPGTYTVSSLTTLYNLLYLCGGPSSLGSFRSIEIVRGNVVKRVADLYAFLSEGNQSDNVLLQEGDVVRIPYYKNIVKIKGNVKREGTFEMLENETFEKLLKLCGGFKDDAFKSTVYVNRLTDTGKIILDLNKPNYNTFKSNGGDEYIVGKNREEFANRVSLKGSVVRPGNYELSDNLSLKDLIEKAGGLLSDAFTEKVVINRYQKNKTPLVFSVDLDSVLQFNKEVVLKKDDEIFINSIFDFKDKQFITIEGVVRNPQKLNWRDSMKLGDAIIEAGGISELGDTSRIEISRRVKNASTSQKNHLETETFLMNAKSDFSLQPFDIIIVKTMPGYVAQRSVLVQGDVRIPGKYVLQKSGDRLIDIFERTLGFKASADSNSITIRRMIKSNFSIQEREKMFQRLLNIDNDSIASNQKLKDEIYKSYELISVNIGLALENPLSPENLILEDGDIITIEKNTQLVKVSGEIYYPTTIPFKEGKRAKYYIKQAGNFMPTARKSEALVIYPDGKAKSVKRFLFFKHYPKVTSRSEIFVPQKSKSNRTKIGIAELAVIASTLGVIANVILATKK
jgi:protein involved in polysaccharide export with SLBB domain